MSFRPKPLPEFPAIWRELQRVAESFDTVHDLETLNSLPDKPRNGMIRYFESGVVTGGSAAGYWAYEEGSWKKFTLT